MANQTVAFPLTWYNDERCPKCGCIREGSWNIPCLRCAMKGDE